MTPWCLWFGTASRASTSSAARRDLLVRSGAPLAGIVLNAVDLNAPEYYGYYGYTGYSYSSLDPAGWDSAGSKRSKASGGSNGGSSKRKDGE